MRVMVDTWLVGVVASEQPIVDTEEDWWIMLMGDAVEEYLTLRKAKVAKTTFANDSSSVRRLLAHVGNIQTRNLKPRHMESYFYGPDAAAAKLAANSWNVELVRVRNFVRFCEGRKYITSDPMMNIDRRRQHRREFQRLSASQLLSLLEAANHPRDRAVVALAINTAMRASEVINLRIGDLNLDSGYLRVWVSKSRVEDMRPITSDLDQEMRRWLTYYTNEHGRLQPEWYLVPAREAPLYGRDGMRLKPNVRLGQAERVVTRALSKLELPTHREGVHTIRRSVARLYFETLRAEGYDGALQATKALLNHQSAEMTERYLGLTMERQKRDLSLRGRPFLTAMVDSSNVVPLRGQA